MALRMGDAMKPPREHFDTALLLHVLEHIDDADGCLTTLRSTADRLIVEVPLFDKDELNLIRLDLGVDFSSDADHVREYTHELLKAQLTRNGWEVLDCVQGPISIAAWARQN